MYSYILERFPYLPAVRVIVTRAEDADDAVPRGGDVACPHATYVTTNG